MSDAVVRLPAELASRVDELAQREMRSRSNAAVRLIAESLARREQAEKGTRDE
jgi:predicted transcriptional regulator